MSFHNIYSIEGQLLRICIRDKVYLLRRFRQKIAMQSSRVSLGSGHARDSFTDHLYDPLRKTILEDTTAKKPILEQAAKVSKVSHFLSPADYQQNRMIAESTLIPEYARLKRCEDLSMIPRDKNYCIFNAQRKKLDPISLQELEMRLRGKHRTEEIIVYSYDSEQTVPQDNYRKLNNSASRYRPESHKSIKKAEKEGPKYNLFSIFDEGINNLLRGQSWSMPSNQIIASRRKKHEWQLSKS